MFSPAAAALGYTLGSMVSTFDGLILVVIACVVPMFSLNPMFNPGTSIPWFLLWTTWVSPFNWGAKVLMIWAWKDIELETEDTSYITKLCLLKKDDWDDASYQVGFRSPGLKKCRVHAGADLWTHNSFGAWESLAQVHLFLGEAAFFLGEGDIVNHTHIWIAKQQFQLQQHTERGGRASTSCLVRGIKINPVILLSSRINLQRLASIFNPPPRTG